MKPPGTNAGSGSISRLRPRFADRRSRIPGPSLFNVSNVQNPNREGKRLETAVSRRKQTIRDRSNREKEAYFSTPKFGRIYGPPRRRGVGSRRPRFGGGCWFIVQKEKSTETAWAENPAQRRASGD